MMRRLDAVAGEWLDRSRPVDFTFEGRALRGYDGDTLSSALAGAGVMITARSFKYHRPRGLYSAADHDANNLFQCAGTPNVRGDVTALKAGMSFSAVNTRGGVRRDRGALMERLAPFLPVGFYYKTAAQRRLFPHFERLIRRLSGLGQVVFAAQHAPTPKRYAFCDVAIVGGGIAGLSAALAAADTARVTLVEEGAHLGGSGLWGRSAEPERHGLARQLAARAHAHPNISVLTGTCAVGYFSDHLLALMETHRLTKLRAGAVVLATGAIEQPAVFPNNDMPGVMLASAAQRLLYRYAIAPGRRICVLLANREGLEVALDLHAHGITIAALLDLRVHPQDDAALEAPLRTAHIEFLRDCTQLEALPDADGCLAAVRVHGAGQPRRIECDALLLSTGWLPALQLALQAGATLAYDTTQQQLLPQSLPTGLWVAGRANGCYDLQARVRDGEQAGAQAARLSVHAEGAVSRSADSAHRSLTPRSLAAPFLVPAGMAARAAKSFVDLDEDLTIDDLRNALHEGFDGIELLKRYSTVGMGPSQGKLSNLNAARLVALHHGGDFGSLALTTARPPYQPVPLALLAGRGFTPQRRTALDALHDHSAAIWMPAANWRRPEYYRKDDTPRAACIEAEVRTVREHAGVIDVGTLGKIEVQGPDAAVLLERVYTGRFADMVPGTTRYALMLDDCGTLIDDGVVARLDVEHFYFTTTTSGSANVYRELLRQVAEQGLDCVLHNLTGHLAAINVAGPRSRELLAPLLDLSLDAASFPYLAVRRTTLHGTPASLLRVGFVGELGYEIHLPPRACRMLWSALLQAGVCPFGVEAQRVLRLEKGHLIVGQDSDGLTNPFELNAGWAVRMDKAYFTGQRSLRILQQRGARQRLIGFEVPSTNTQLRECHLVMDGDDIGGRITSIAWSPTLRRQIGLALVKPHLAVTDGSLALRGDDDGLTAARIVPTPFYDARHARQRAHAEVSHAA